LSVGNVVRVSIWVLLVGLLMAGLTLANMPRIADAADDKKPTTVTVTTTTTETRTITTTVPTTITTTVPTTITTTVTATKPDDHKKNKCVKHKSGKNKYEHLWLPESAVDAHKKHGDYVYYDVKSEAECKAKDY
jgi:hypothetical protein